LKPQNVMVDEEGNARILDFGIARSLKAKGITGTGVMIGTPEYMSPEQVEGKEVDQRSDIYSLGVILYEMVTGRVPFEGDTPLSIAVKHKTEMPKEPREFNTQIPEDLSRLILKCMEKDKGKRYQSAGEVRSELERIEKRIPATERIIPKRKPVTSREITVTFGLKKLYTPALVVIAITIIAVIIWQILSQKQIASLEPAKSSIAVLPFSDLSPNKDQEHFCDGMTDEIIVKLSRLEEWKVIPRTSVRQYKDTNKDIREIGKELDVANILDGSVRKEKDDIRVTATLINVKDGFQLWSDIYDKKLERVFDIQNEIAEKIAEALKIELSPEEKKQIQKNPTENLEAYNLYLKGRWFWNIRTEEGIEEAIKYFTDACEEDAHYALAYAGLADCYTMASSYGYKPPKEVMPKAKSAVVKALEIDETLSEAHASLAFIKLFYEWDKYNAKIEFERAIQLNPNYGTAHQWYANCLTVFGRHDEAIAEAKRARALDPLSPIINRN
ncbi:protein kinase, partial [bacterium]|nr:protein kinase [bacterium]